MEKIIGIRSKSFENDLYKEFYEHINDILDNQIVHKMKTYIQHGNTTCFQHCLNVAYYNFKICNFLKLNAKSAARAGMLHDFFLYDWHCLKKKKGDKYHAFAHASIACENAKKYFNINELESDIITKHMFPLTLSPPKYKETIVIILTDKYCTILETLYPRLINLKKLFFNKKTNKVV